MSEPTTHDYTRRGWGHDCIFAPINGGLSGRMTGWGRGLKSGDFLLLSNRGGTTRYQIKAVEYYFDPPDMWKADVEFAPRAATPPAQEGDHG